MRYKTFEDLEFQERPIRYDYEHPKQQAVMFFKNGYGVSVLLGEDFYSNGINTYEVAVIKGNADEWYLCYDTPITDDVLGYQTKEQVTEIVRKVQELSEIYKNRTNDEEVQKEASSS